MSSRLSTANFLRKVARLTNTVKRHVATLMAPATHIRAKRYEPLQPIELYLLPHVRPVQHEHKRLLAVTRLRHIKKQEHEHLEPLPVYPGPGMPVDPSIDYDELVREAVPVLPAKPDRFLLVPDIEAIEQCYNLLILEIETAQENGSSWLDIPNTAGGFTNAGSFRGYINHMINSHGGFEMFNDRFYETVIHLVNANEDLNDASWLKAFLTDVFDNVGADFEQYRVERINQLAALVKDL